MYSNGGSGGDVGQVYASTEAGILTYARIGTPNMVEGAAGFVLPWVEIDTVNPDGRPLRQGAEGLLQIRTPDLAEYVLPPACERALIKALKFAGELSGATSVKFIASL